MIFEKNSCISHKNWKNTKYWNFKSVKQTGQKTPLPVRLQEYVTSTTAAGCPPGIWKSLFLSRDCRIFFYYNVAFIYGRILQMLRYFRFRNASTFFGFEISMDKILWMLATEKARKQSVSIHLRLEINGDPSTWLSGIFDPKRDEFKT